LRKRFFREATPLREALEDLNNWIYTNFTYKPGVTNVSTPLSTVLRQRKGVCQDFAHLMLSIIRHNGLPARYVSGYIEPVDPTRPGGSELVGAAASHAWVEVNLPNGTWWGLDPTNNQCAGERHVKVAVGRDYHDVAPLRGTFKGASNQKLQVIVSMKRKTPSRRTP
jgi:transglutaminase-like putative cysteine protease